MLFHERGMFMPLLPPSMGKRHGASGDLIGHTLTMVDPDQTIEAWSASRVPGRTRGNSIANRGRVPARTHGDSIANKGWVPGRTHGEPKFALRESNVRNVEAEFCITRIQCAKCEGRNLHYANPMRVM